jgi:hypothetical protein
LHARQRVERELRLQRHHRLRRGGRGVARLAEEHKHVYDVRHVLLADFLGFLVVVEVVPALRQPEAALAEARHLSVALLQVGSHAKRKSRSRPK